MDPRIPPARVRRQPSAYRWACVALILGSLFLTGDEAEAQKWKKLKKKVAKTLEKAADKLGGAAGEAEEAISEEAGELAANNPIAGGTGCTVHDVECFVAAREAKREPQILYYDGTVIVDSEGAKPFSTIAPLKVTSPHELFESLYLPATAEDEPRLGVQDDLGTQDQRITTTLGGARVSALKEVKQSRERSLASFALLLHVHHLSGAYKILDRENLPVRHDKSADAAARGNLAPLVYPLLLDRHVARFFCVVPDRCQKRHPNYIANPQARVYFGGQGADEFQRRGAYQDFMKTGYEPLRAWARDVGRKFQRASYVDQVSIGDYDFDRGGFDLRLQMSSFAMGGVAFHFVPDQGFEKSMVLESGQSVASTGVLRMSPDHAQALLARLEGTQGHRRLYYVVTITIDGPFESDRPLTGKNLRYSVADSVVRVFEDTALRVPLTEMDMATDFSRQERQR